MVRARSGVPSRHFSSKFIIASQQKTLLMWQNNSATISKMIIDIDAAEVCLKKMKECSELANAPPKIDNDLRSAITVSDDCIEKFKKCEQFVDESLRLESYVKEQSKTKAMLLLIKYGNTNEFERRAKSAIEQLSNRNGNLTDYFRKLTDTVESTSCVCEKCDGSGTIENQIIVRENGSPPGVIIRTSSCTACEGNGRTTMNPGLKRKLKVCLENLNRIESIISKNIVTINNIVSTSLREIGRDSSDTL